MGVRLVLDDFGKGYSSLSYLRRLPVDEIKIDRSFIIGLAEGEDDTLVRCMIELAHNLGLTVVGEGVESEAVLHQLGGAELRRGSGLLHHAAGAGPRHRRLDRKPRRRRALRKCARPRPGRRACRRVALCGQISYALTVMSLVHHAHHCHHHRSSNGPAGACA